MFSFKEKNIKKYKLSRIFRLLLTAYLLLPFVSGYSRQLQLSPLQDTIKSDSIIILDTLNLKSDSIIIDSAVSKAIKKPILDGEVTYSSEDSLIFSINQQKVYLYDKGVVNYKVQDVSLTGDYIEFDYNTKVVMAAAVPDSTGRITTKPEFTQGDEKLNFDTMRYNFDTRKAKIKSIITQQGEGYLHSTQTKRLQSGEIHIKDGKYTTCDSPLPHFYISLTKAISIPGKRTISGPAYLVFEDIPMPLGLPFGFFPNTNKRTSGFLIPEFRDEQRRGFGLENGGWYFALNDYLDFSIVGSIYSRGTWGLKTISEYNVNYKFHGQFSAEFFMNRINDDPSATSSQDFKVKWSHSQDSKANPTRTFSASVDFSTRSYEQRQGTSFSDILENQKNSSISFTKRWPGRPFNFSANLKGSQSNITKTVNITLPSVSFNMERIYPFRGKNTSGDYNWLENITLAYNSSFLNRIKDAPDSTLFTESTLKRMENGFTHNIPISLSNIKVLKKYVNITPSVSYTGTVFPYYVRKSVSPDSSVFSKTSIVTDTIHKITYAHAFAASLSISTSPKFYGTYLSKKENSKIIAVRHVITPKAGLSFSPDMKGLVPDYYRDIPSSSSITQPIKYTSYSVYEGQMNSTPSVSGKSGSVSLALSNNLEAKVRSKSDTTGEGKKVSLLDNLDFSTSYKPFAESRKWSPINVTSRSSLFNKKLSLQFNGTLDPYALDSVGKSTDKYLISQTGKLFRLTRAQFSMSFDLRSAAGKKEETTVEATETESYEDVEDIADMYDEAGGAIRSQYVNFDIPWSVHFDYSWSYTKPGLTKSINSSLSMSGDISLTPKWKIGASSAYDFVAKEFSATVIRIHRDLHCWEMSFSIVPVGSYKSYSFTINAKSSILRDLKWDKRKSWQDNF